MKKIYYEKVGHEYVPVAEYDNNYLDSFPKGNTLVMCYPGGSSRKYNINPALAPMIAAGRYAEDAMSKALIKASEKRPHNTPVTPAQQRAWKNLAKAFNSELCYIELPSAQEVVAAGVRAMELEADKLMQHESVKKAYDHFMLVCSLTKEVSE